MDRAAAGNGAVEAWETALSETSQPSVDDILGVHSPAEAAQALKALRQMKQDLQGIERTCLDG